MNFLASVSKGLRERISLLMAAMTKGIIMRSVRKNIHAVWLKGTIENLPKGNYILAPNHHSWWDAYMLWFITRRLGCDFRVLMDEVQLAKFYFFRHLGALGTSEIRAALRFLKPNELRYNEARCNELGRNEARYNEASVLVIFPEGGIRQATKVQAIEKGLDYFSEKAAVPVVPLAIRTVFRGAQLPEVFLNFGEAIDFSSEISEDYMQVMNRLLDELDKDIASLPPEEPIEEGYTVWQAPRARIDERIARVLAFGQSIRQVRVKQSDK